MIKIYKPTKIDNLSYELYIKDLKKDDHYLRNTHIISKTAFITFKNVIYNKFYKDAKNLIRREKLNQLNKTYDKS